MGLYLCIFEKNEDIAGIDVGAYSDFGAFRGYITHELEGGRAGSCFPVLMLHSDCDGEWPVSKCEPLRNELLEISRAMMQRPPVPFPSEWQMNVAKSLSHVPRTAYECFLDVDGEYLIARLLELINIAIERKQPILFQ